MPRLRAMTEPEYEQFHAHNVDHYAQERARNFDTPLDQERVAAEQQLGALLPFGLRSPGHHFWVVEEGDEPVGRLWVSHADGGERAFIYYIEVLPAYRRRGYGARALELLEEELRPRGVRRLALNVFADNAVAQRLYARQGYRVTNCQMQKRL